MQDTEFPLKQKVMFFLLNCCVFSMGSCMWTMLWYTSKLLVHGWTSMASNTLLTQNFLHRGHEHISLFLYMKKKYDWIMKWTVFVLSFLWPIFNRKYMHFQSIFNRDGLLFDVLWWLHDFSKFYSILIKLQLVKNLKEKNWVK